MNLLTLTVGSRQHAPYTAAGYPGETQVLVCPRRSSVGGRGLSACLEEASRVGREG